MSYVSSKLMSQKKSSAERIGLARIENLSRSWLGQKSEYEKIIFYHKNNKGLYMSLFGVGGNTKSW